MTPRASARGAALASFRAAWIALGRNCIVVRRVPVAAPLVHVVAHVVETVCVGFAPADWLRASIPIRSAPLRIVRKRLRRCVAPGIERVFAASASGALPL